jgi:acyl-CoA dehydrogenase
MSGMRSQLIETATALLGTEVDAAAWSDAGFCTLLAAEADGGFGGDWGDAEAVLRLVGYHRPELDVAPQIISAAKGDPFYDGALATVALIGGAMERVLDLSIEYANTRIQFGKPIGKQQAVQQALAMLAQETAITAAAAQGAADARDRGSAEFEIGCAKLRANRAAAAGVAIAHQVHGAIGFTQEFALHRYTRKLSEWRSASGGGAFWAERAGTFALEAAGSALWPRLVARAEA